MSAGYASDDLGWSRAVLPVERRTLGGSLAREVRRSHKAKPKPPRDYVRLTLEQQDAIIRASIARQGGDQS